MSGKKYLFVCGCPRSGTTALGTLLAADPRIVIGIERYGHFWNKSFRPELFERERFFTVMPDDTFYDDLFAFGGAHYRAMQEKFDSAVYVGDKIPMLFSKLDDLAVTIPGAKVLMLIRNIFDVSASYNARADNPNDLTWNRDKRTGAAIRDWAASLVALRDAPKNLECLPVVYEELFGKRCGLSQIYEFLELGEPSESTCRNYERVCARAAQLERARGRALSEDDVFEITQTAPFGLYREMTKGRFSQRG